MPTTLPKLDTDYALSPEQIARYQSNGHIALRGVASGEEIAAYQPIIARTVEEYKLKARGGVYAKPLEKRDTYNKAFLQIENIWKMNDDVARFVLARRFAKIAAELMGVDGVRVFHDQALFKEAGGGYTPWHQDQYYWPFDTDNTITMWMPLVDSGVEMGTLVFGDGTHRDQGRDAIPISDESEAVFRRQCADVNLTAYELYAGDATWHGGWTLHKAAGNSSSQVREAVTIIYHADGARVIEPTNEVHELSIDTFLGGRQPGELADDESINPLVYKES